MNEFINKIKLLKSINENIAEEPNKRCAQILETILVSPTVRLNDITNKIFADIRKEIRLALESNYKAKKE